MKAEQGIGTLSLMRRIALIAALLIASLFPSFAQEVTGNWSCRDASTNRAGILTIYGQVYGFASRTAGDAASGTGSITSYQDGVGFNDGNLRASRDIQAGRLVPDPTYGQAMQLETANAVVMLCTPR